MKQITSRDNPLFKQLKKLATSSRERRKSSCTLLDGVHLLQSYFACGGVPEKIIITEQGLQDPEIASWITGRDEESVILLTAPMFSELSPVETPSGLMALIAIPAQKALVKTDFCLFIEDVQDPGNLGSILRSAAAAGVDVAYLSPGCVDAWSPKVLRGGMGAHFAVVVEEDTNLVEKLSRFKGVSLATVLNAEKSLYELDLRGSVGILVGNEGAGLSDALMSVASERIRIPMSDGVESLNVAAATAICLFERVRQCKPLPSGAFLRRERRFQ